MKFSTHLHLLATFGMTGAISLLPLYVFMVRTGTNLVLYCHKENRYYTKKNQCNDKAYVSLLIFISYFMPVLNLCR